MKVSRKDITLFLMLLVVWMLVLFISPLTTYIATRNLDNALTMLRMMTGMLQAPLVLFFLNFYVLWRFFFAKRRYLLFAAINLLLLVGANAGMIFMLARPERFAVQMPRQAWMGIYSGHFVYLLLCVFVIAAAIALRHWLTTRQIRQQLVTEQAKRHEAELAMLKTQLNPHFLFNTLNNISSMVQIDPDQAQDSIAQLSDLLRYTLYESSATQVPLEREIEFMHNYIDLMKLRYSDTADIDVEMPVPNGPVQIAPLLFISLIENAFKHGVSSCEPSFVKITLTTADHQLTFSCENSFFPKQQTDHVGSGIGLENMRKRLELAYGGRYNYHVEQTDKAYKATVAIRLPA